MIENSFKDFVNTVQSKVQELGEAAPGASQIRAVIESQLRKLNLVTREEFDAQNAVLMRTREKVDALEKQIADIEAALNSQSDAPEA
ncbi:MAG: BMFP domain-containing protein YqiC [Flavobacteriales bacterium]|jgi:BMFP domain-containing protein YqiC